MLLYIKKLDMFLKETLNFTLRTKHAYHLIDPSLCPLLGSFSVFMFTVGLVTWMQHFIGGWLLLLNGVFLIVYVMSGWWRDVIREATFEDQPRIKVRRGLNFGAVAIWRHYSIVTRQKKQIIYTLAFLLFLVALSFQLNLDLRIQIVLILSFFSTLLYSLSVKKFSRVYNFNQQDYLKYFILGNFCTLTFLFDLFSQMHVLLFSIFIVIVILFLVSEFQKEDSLTDFAFDTDFFFSLLEENEEIRFLSLVAVSEFISKHGSSSLVTYEHEIDSKTLEETVLKSERYHELNRELEDPKNAHIKKLLERSYLVRKKLRWIWGGVQEESPSFSICERLSFMLDFLDLFEFQSAFYERTIDDALETSLMLYRGWFQYKFVYQDECMAQVHMTAFLALNDTLLLLDYWNLDPRIKKLRSVFSSVIKYAH